MRRATEAELLRRVETICMLMRNGDSSRDIYQFCRDNYKVADRQARSYIAAARAKFAEEGRVLRAAHVGKVMSRIDELYARARAQNDIPLMLSVVREQIKIVGMTETTTDPELDAAVERLTTVVPAALEGDEITASELPYAGLVRDAV